MEPRASPFDLVLTKLEAYQIQCKHGSYDKRDVAKKSVEDWKTFHLVHVSKPSENVESRGYNSCSGHEHYFEQKSTFKVILNFCD